MPQSDTHQKGTAPTEAEPTPPTVETPAPLPTHAEESDLFELQLYETQERCALAENRASVAELELARIKLHSARTAFEAKYKTSAGDTIDKTSRLINRAK